MGLVLKLTCETSLSCCGQAEPPGPDTAFLITRFLSFLKVFFLKATAVVLCFSKNLQAQMWPTAALCVGRGSEALCTKASVNALFRDSFSLVLSLLPFPALELVPERQKNLVPVQSLEFIFQGQEFLISLGLYEK